MFIAGKLTVISDSVEWQLKTKINIKRPELKNRLLQDMEKNLAMPTAYHREYVVRGSSRLKIMFALMGIR